MKDTESTAKIAPKKLLAAGLCLVATYAFASWAIDSGSYWHYLATFVFLSGAIKLGIQAFKK